MHTIWSLVLLGSTLAAPPVRPPSGPTTHARPSPRRAVKQDTTRAGFAALAAATGGRLVRFERHAGPRGTEKRVMRDTIPLDAAWLSTLAATLQSQPSGACPPSTLEPGEVHLFGMRVEAGSSDAAVELDYRDLCARRFAGHALVETRSIDGVEGSLAKRLLALRPADEQLRLLVAAFPRDAVYHAAPKLPPLPEPTASDPPPLDPSPTQVDGSPHLGQYVYVEELPEPIERPGPEYPAAARGQRGLVMVQALVGKDGSVLKTQITKSDPPFDEAAMACVKKWRFKPALSKGQPVIVWVAVPVAFEGR